MMLATRNVALRVNGVRVTEAKKKRRAGLTTLIANTGNQRDL
jgi:hypothetical protein